MHPTPPPPPPPLQVSAYTAAVCSTMHEDMGSRAGKKNLPGSSQGGIFSPERDENIQCNVLCKGIDHASR